jgi:orotate phosphoribosyltransferase
MTVETEGVEKEMNVLQELDSAGAVLLDRHFVYTSGKHGSGYINLDPLFPNVGLMAKICARLVEPFLGEFDTVAAPAVGGIELAVLAAAAADNDERPVAVAWADKNDNGFRFERAGFEQHITGKRVLVVEDLLTTGDSVAKVCDQARSLGAELIGVSVICNRGGVSASDLGVPVLAELATVNFTAVAEAECELCANAEPIVEDVGHGGAYKERHPDYQGGFVRLLS